MADLSAHLRIETSALREQLEALPFFRALPAVDLPRVAIASFLHKLLQTSGGQIAAPAETTAAEQARTAVLRAGWLARAP